MTIRIGLIGLGYWGRTLLRVFSDLPDASVHAVADVVDSVALSAVTSNSSARVLPVRSLLAIPDIDAVLIATPPSTHFESARLALEAGKHCWVEKPLALRPDHATELVSLAACRQRVLFVDETFLYDPLIRTARDWIAAGRLGHVWHYRFERTGMGRIRRDSDVWWNSAPHDLSILRFLSSANVRSMRVDKFTHLQSGVADMCSAVIHLDDGASAHVYLSWLSPRKAASVIVVGDRGMLRYEGRFDQRSLSFFEYTLGRPDDTANLIGIAGFEPRETLAGGTDEPLTLAARAFLECVRSGAPAPSEGRFSAQVVEWLAWGDSTAAAPGHG